MNLEEMLDDNELKEVPEEDRVPGWRIAFIIVGIAIGLPLMLTGAELGNRMAFGISVLAVLLGGIVLAILSAITGAIGASQRVSTYMLVERTFGVTGAKIVNVILIMTILGWFGISASVFGDAMSKAAAAYGAPGIGSEVFTTLGVVLMIATSIFGFKSLDLLALIAVPLLCLLLAGLAYYGLQLGGASMPLKTDHVPIAFGDAVSMVIGSFIVGVVLFPDYCRYARSPMHGAIAGVLSLGVGFPIVLIASIIPARATGQSDLVALLFALGAGIPALFLLVIATWTTNASNLYSASLAMSVEFKGISRWKVTIAAGVLGGLLAIFGIASNLVGYLVLLSFAIPPIAGIYIVDATGNYLGLWRPDNRPPRPKVSAPALFAWCAGSFVGWLSSIDMLVLTTLPAIDSLLVASVTFWILEWRTGFFQRNDPR